MNIEVMDAHRDVVRLEKENAALKALVEQLTWMPAIRGEGMLICRHCNRLRVPGMQHRDRCPAKDVK